VSFLTDICSWLRNSGQAGIAGCKKGEDQALPIAEATWITRLGTLDEQRGIHSMDERRRSKDQQS
jgi:hypothetical protein